MVIVIVIHHYSVPSYVCRHVSVSASELMFILHGVEIILTRCTGIFGGIIMVIVIVIVCLATLAGM